MTIVLSEVLEYKEVYIYSMRKVDRSWLIRELIKRDIDFKIENKILKRI